MAGHRQVDERPVVGLAELGRHGDDRGAVELDQPGIDAQPDADRLQERLLPRPDREESLPTHRVRKRLQTGLLAGCERVRDERPALDPDPEGLNVDAYQRFEGNRDERDVTTVRKAHRELGVLRFRLSRGRRPDQHPSGDDPRYRASTASMGRFVSAGNRQTAASPCSSVGLAGGRDQSTRPTAYAATRESAPGRAPCGSRRDGVDRGWEQQSSVGCRDVQLRGRLMSLSKYHVGSSVPSNSSENTTSAGRSNGRVVWFREGARARLVFPPRTSFGGAPCGGSDGRSPP